MPALTWPRQGPGIDAGTPVICAPFCQPDATPAGQLTFNKIKGFLLCGSKHQNQCSGFSAGIMRV